MNGCLSVVRHITELANGGVKTISTIEGGGLMLIGRMVTLPVSLIAGMHLGYIFPGW